MKIIACNGEAGEGKMRHNNQPKRQQKEERMLYQIFVHLICFTKILMKALFLYFNYT